MTDYGPSATANAPETMWWEADDDDIAAQLVSRADDIRANHLQRYRRTEEHYCLYGDAYGFAYEDLPLYRTFRNVAAEAIDAKVAELNQDPVRIVVTLRGEAWHVREQTRYWSWYTDAAFAKHNIPKLQLQCTRDASIAGIGQIVVVDEEDGPRLERVHPLDLFVDDAGCVDIEPPELVIRRRVSRHWLARRAKRAGKDKLAQDILDSPASEGSHGRDVVDVFEGWYEGFEDDPGKHVQAARGVDEALLVEDWDGRPPWAYVQIHEPTQGLWGESDMSRAAPIQIERNKLSDRIRDGLHWVVPQLYVQQGTVVDSSITNEPGSPVETTVPPAQAVQPIVMPGMGEDVYARERVLDEDIYSAVQASKDFASGDVPARLSSGRALRIHRAINNRRIGPALRNIGAFIERVMLELARGEVRAKERNPSHKVLVNVSGVNKELAASTLELDVNTIQIRAEAASSLGLDPASEFDDLQDMFANGLITKDELWQHAKTPDAEKIRRMAVSHIDMIEAEIDSILYEGELRPPPTYINAPKALEMGTKALMRARIDKAPADRLTMLRVWIGLIAQQLQPPAPPPKAMAPPPGPEMGMPGELPPELPPDPAGAPEGMPMPPPVAGPPPGMLPS